MTKTQSAAEALKPIEICKGLWKVKHPRPKSFFKIGVGKKHNSSNTLYFEIQGKRKFEIGNDCDTCHFWFKCLQEPKNFANKKIVNLPKAISIPRPLDETFVSEIEPLIEMMDKGEHYIFNTTVDLTGPFRSDDEESYFHNTEFMEIWDIEDPAAEDILSNWEHYEGKHPRIYRHEAITDKLFKFLIPLVPVRKLKEENIRLYKDMISNGDRPRILALGMLQRAIPESVKEGNSKTMHSFFAGVILDGHHKLAAYRRAGVPANLLIILSSNASKYFPLEGEGSNTTELFEKRLASLLVAARPVDFRQTVLPLSQIVLG